MVCFVNAKINIGLQIVRRCENGYHDLQTIFYPIGIYAGLPENPVSFCDILEITPRKKHTNGSEPFALHLAGRPLDCSPEKNLVYKAASLFFEKYCPELPVDIYLEKHIPDGAGIGGGSADAAFTLRMLASHYGVCDDLGDIALKLGADVPFFLLNRAAYAQGVGEKLSRIPLDLSGNWLLLIKPDLYISTREAFSGVSPHAAAFDLRALPDMPLKEWKEYVHNDFEDSIFPRHPFMADIKSELYSVGALYASLTGSGSCLYGIFASESIARKALHSFKDNPTIAARYLLKL